MQYRSKTKAVEDEAISLRTKISDLFSNELSDVPCESVVTVTQTVAVTGNNKELWPQTVKVTVAPTKMRVVTLRGQPHGEK
jgi:hypothetical protein